MKTKEAYVHWIKRFILLHNKRHPKDMGEKVINKFVGGRWNRQKKPGDYLLNIFKYFNWKIG